MPRVSSENVSPRGGRKGSPGCHSHIVDLCDKDVKIEAPVQRIHLGALGKPVLAPGPFNQSDCLLVRELDKNLAPVPIRVDNLVDIFCCGFSLLHHKLSQLFDNETFLDKSRSSRVCSILCQSDAVGNFAISCPACPSKSST